MPEGLQKTSSQTQTKSTIVVMCCEAKIGRKAIGLGISRAEPRRKKRKEKTSQIFLYS